MSKLAVPIGLLISAENSPSNSSNTLSKVTKPLHRPNSSFSSFQHSFLTQGSSFKLLKACNFCRKRKIKCTVPQNSSICENCMDHLRDCVFEHKEIPHTKSVTAVPKKSDEAEVQNSPPSVLSLSPHLESGLTRQIESKLNSQLTSVQLSESIAQNTKNLSSYTGTFLDHIEPYELAKYNRLIQGIYPRIHSPLDSSSAVESVISPGSLTYNEASTRDSLKLLYVEYIEPYTPFLTYDMFEQDFLGFNACCINLSSISSPNNLLPNLVIDSFLGVIHHELNTNVIEWDITTLACFFLLPLRIIMPRHLVEQSLEAFNELYEKEGDYLSLNVITGALCVDAWNLLFSHTPLLTNPKLLRFSLEMLRKMNTKDFNYQFVNVTIFVYRLQRLLVETELLSEEKKHKLLLLEFDMLLFPAKLSKNLTVVRDTLLSTPEAFILHILHNMLMIAYYTLAVTVPAYGKMTLLMAVPGLYHFISGMAISNFRVRDQIVDRWSLIADCQIMTAKYLLQLYNIMEFDTFTFTLQFFTRRPNNNFKVSECKELDKQVKEILENAVRDRDDDFDGAVVFWVFRDVRSMSLQMYIDDKRRPST